MTRSEPLQHCPPTTISVKSQCRVRPTALCSSTAFARRTTSSRFSACVRISDAPIFPEKSRTVKNDIAVLSYDAWRNYFGGDRNVLNKTVKLDGRTAVVIGVMPAGFRFSAQYAQCRLLRRGSLTRPG